MCFFSFLESRSMSLVLCVRVTRGVRHRGAGGASTWRTLEGHLLPGCVTMAHLRAQVSENPCRNDHTPDSARSELKRTGDDTGLLELIQRPLYATARARDVQPEPLLARPAQ